MKRNCIRFSCFDKIKFLKSKQGVFNSENMPNYTTESN